MRPAVQPGDIRLIAGSYTPAGWLTCDGSKVKVADQPEIFKVIGAAYGGDGMTNFALPNFQAEVPVDIASGMKIGQVGRERITLPAHAAKLRYIIAAHSSNWDTAFVGEIRNYAFGFAPSKWARCEGQLLPIAGNTALFSLFMETYGGDGKRTFALPDLRGTVVGGDGQRCVGTNYCIALEGMYPPRA